MASRMGENQLSVAGNSLSTNRVAGLKDEFIGEPSVIRLFAAASAAGLRVQMLLGDSTVIDDSEPGVASAAGVIRKPDDLIAEEGSPGSERIILRFRNTTAGAITVTWELLTEAA